MQTDAELVQLCRLNNDTALTSIIERHSGMVLSTCHRQLGTNSLEVDDAVQTTFYTFWQKKNTIRNGQGLSAWLHRTSLLVCSNIRRERDRRLQREQHVANEHSQESIMNPNTDSIEKDTISAALDTAIHALPEKHRTAILAHYIEERSPQELAQEWNISLAAARKRISYSMKKLKRKLDKITGPISITLLLSVLQQQAQAASISTVGAGALTGSILTGQLSSPLSHAVLQDISFQSIKQIFWQTGVAASCLLAGTITGANYLAPTEEPPPIAEKSATLPPIPKQFNGKGNIDFDKPFFVIIKKTSEKRYQRNINIEIIPVGDHKILLEESLRHTLEAQK